jgi:hypothetical protein
MTGCRPQMGSLVAASLGRLLLDCIVDSLQYHALRGGARLGQAISHSSKNGVDEYDRQATMVLDYMQVRI